MYTTTSISLFLWHCYIYNFIIFLAKKLKKLNMNSFTKMVKTEDSYMLQTASMLKKRLILPQQKRLNI